MLADRSAEAIRTLEAGIDENRTVWLTNAILAAAYSQAGRKEDAALKAEVARSRFPLRREDFGSLLRDASHREKLSLLLTEAGL